MRSSYARTLANIDNKWEGNAMLPKAKNSTRIVFHNINSLQPKNTVKWIETLQIAMHHEVDMIGLAETCVNWKLRKVQQRHRKILISEARNNPDPISSAAITFSRNSTEYPKASLPGGTTSVTLGKWTGLLQEYLHDNENMGRWSGQKFRINHDVSLFVITGYRVCIFHPRPDSVPTTSSYWQQHVIMRDQGVVSPDPRQRFIDDIIKHFTSWGIQPQDHVILMLDANEALEDGKQTGIRKLMEQTNLVDVFANKHPEMINDTFPCHINGSKRIDFILARPHTCRFITSIGYAPFYSLFDSDHRGIVLDLDSSITQQPVQPLIAPPIRLIGTNSSSSESTNYIKFIYEQFTYHRIFDKSKDLMQRAEMSLDNDQEYCNELNKVDDLITQIMLKGEKAHCTKKHPVMWSPAILHSCLMVKYWTIKLKAGRRNMNVAPQLEAILAKLPESHAAVIRNNTATPLIALTKEKETQKRLFQEHYELRAEYLKEKQTESSDAGEEAKAQEIQQLQRREELRKDYRELRAIFHPDRSSGISHLEIHDPATGAVTKITDPTDIESTLIDRNIQHFGQAQGTPFTTGQLQELLGYEGDGAIMEGIVNGELPAQLANNGDDAMILIRKLSSGGRLPTICADITVDEFKAAFRKWSEKTSTSPSGRHLGHYKVLLHTDAIPISADNEESMNDHILQVYHWITLAALLSGNSLLRWQKVTTAMIEKIAGCPRIDKLRVIHLYEADYNLVLKVLWARKLVWNAHNNLCLHDGQSGSRPGRRSIDVVIQKEMKYLYARLSRTNLATMDNDAKSCYDRIICNLAMLISRFFGMPLHACRLQAKTLHRMIFRLRTALGDSSSSYQHSWNTPVHGSGQGSCASPCLWLLISSILMECLSEHGHGMKLMNVHNQDTVHQFIDGFVDDTSIFTNTDTTQQDLSPLLRNLKGDTTFWSKLLASSGGLLELPKCFYYILNWKFDKNGIPAATTIAEQRLHTTQLTLPVDSSQAEIVINQKEVTEAHKTLGTMKTIVGDESSHKSFLLAKSDLFATKVLHARMNRRQAKLAYRTIYIPAMLYSLPATNLSEIDLNAIQSKATSRFLSASGYEKGFPRAVVHGPTAYGGLGMQHLYTEALTLKIEALISHIRANTSLGKSMMINLNWTQMMAGTSTPILASVHLIDYIQHNWIMHIRQFLINISATIQIRNVWTPITARVGDYMLMDKLPSMDFSQRERGIINNWRLYFQVTSCSDITNAHGNQIVKRFRVFGSDDEDATGTSALNWPIQAKPGRHSFRLWKKFLQRSTGMDAQGNLRQKLGAWTGTQNDSMRQFKFYLDTDTDLLYVRNHLVFHAHKCNWNRNIVQRFDKFSSTQHYALPDTAVPIDATIHAMWYQVTLPRTRATFRCRNYRNSESSINPVKADGTWAQMIIQTTHDFRVPDLCSLLKSNCKLYLVSDGSLYEQSGGYASVLATDDCYIANVYGATPMVGDLNTSYRTEAYGMLSGLTMLDNTLKQSNCTIQETRIIMVYSDSESLVKTIVRYQHNLRTIKSYYGPDVDVISQIIQIIAALSLKHIQVVIEHVKGHQDNTASTIPLSRPASLNVEADRLAGLHLELPIPDYYDFDANPVTLRVNGDVITSKYKYILRNCYLTQGLREYMVHKYDWSQDIPDKIWWKCNEKALDQLHINDRARIQKFLFNRWATNHREALYYAHAQAACSACQEPDETADHILRCSDPRRIEIRTQWLAELAEYMTDHHTPSEVNDVIISGLSTWFKAEPHTSSRHIHPSSSADLRKAVREQNQIGWDHFVKGRLTKEWASFINHEMTRKKIDTKYYSAEKWGSDIISINWKYVLELWQARNADEHGTDQKEQHEKAKEKLLAEVNWIQDQNLNIQGEDRAYILTPKDTLEKMNSNHIQAWIRNVKILIKASDRTLHTLIRTMDLRPYLTQLRRRDAKSGLHTPTCSVRTRPIH
jgi:hypothetical protein